MQTDTGTGRSGAGSVSHRPAVLGTLLERAGPDGGFAAVPGGPPRVEATAWAALALRAVGGEAPRRAERRALAWLVSRQRSDGAFPLSDEVAGASWATAPVLLALGGAGGAHAEARRAASRWLVASEGRRPGMAQRVVRALMQRDAIVEQDPMLRGWSWHPEAASWVEPTALAILALRRQAAAERPPEAAARVREGLRLIEDRACPGGGWNYGNARVLGADLHPYPDVTALALLALRGGPAALVESGFTALRRLLRGDASVLSLSLASLAFALHGRDAEVIRARLAERLRRAPISLTEELRPLALAVLALAGGETHLAPREDA